MPTDKKIEDATEQAALLARFAHNVRVRRVQKKISQDELAARAGLHRTFVSDVEREIRNVALSNIGKLARALELDVMELFMPVEQSEKDLPKFLPKGPKRSVAHVIPTMGEDKKGGE